jgi:iron complex outermembrane receptor protein
VLGVLLGPFVEVARAQDEGAGPPVGSENSDPASNLADLEALEELEHLSLAQLLEVEVESVSLRSERVTQAPGVLSVISWHSFRIYQYTSIADALQVQPDVDVLDDHSSYNVGVRGVNAGWGAQSKVFKLMLDRQDIGFRPTAGGFLGPEAMPLLAIRHVEVIRGPLSALYGANAFLGVINIVPQTAQSMSRERPGHGVSKGTYINSWGNQGASGEAAQWWHGERLDLFGAVAVRSTRRDGLRLPRSSPRYDNIEASGVSLTTRDDHERTASAYLRGGLDLKSAGEITLDGVFQYADRTGHFDPDSEPLLGARLTFYNTTSRLRYELKPTEPWTFQASLGISTGGPTDAQRLYDPFRPGIEYIQREYEYLQGNGSLSVCYERSSIGSLTVGADLQVDREQLPGLVLHEQSGDEQRVDTGRSYVFRNEGAFIQGTLVIAKGLTGLAGARYERHNLYGVQLNYRGVLVYSFAEDTSIKALFGSAFQAPSPVLLFGGEHPRLTGISDNSQLQPQRVRSTELAFTSRFLQLMRVELSVYYNQLTDFAELDTVTAGPKATNRSRVDALGGSVQLDVQPTRVPLNAFANLSYVFTDVGTDELPTLRVSRQTRLYPALKLNLGASYTIRRAYIRPFATYRWVGPRAADKSNLAHLPAGQLEEYFLDSYILLDLGLASSGLRLFGNHETLVSMRATNALGARYAQPGFAGIDVPGRERTVYVSVEQEY